MAGGGGDREAISAGNYPHLTFTDEENCYSLAASAFSDQNAPRMLCFGEEQHFSKQACDAFFEQVGTRLALQTAGMTCSGGDGGGYHPSQVTAAYSPGSSSTNGQQINAAAAGAGRISPVWSVTPPAVSEQQRSSKKAKTSGDSPASTPRHAKVKRVKLGERIMALQQLVSPFGKTDTASVLQEALGYIKFLQEQVQALCSPYLQRLPPQAPLQTVKEEDGAGPVGGGAGRDLQSIGLCLVPADLTEHVADLNGADLWTPGSSPFKMASRR